MPEESRKNNPLELTLHMCIFSINVVWSFLGFVYLIFNGYLFGDRVWWSYAMKGELELLTLLALPSRDYRLYHAILWYFAGSHIYYNFGIMDIENLSIFYRNHLIKMVYGILWKGNMSCDFPARGYMVHTESIMAMSNNPAAQKTEGTQSQPPGSHTATTAGSLHQFPYVQHGRDGQRPTLQEGLLPLDFILFNICFYIHKSSRRQLCSITYTSSTNFLFTSLSFPSEWHKRIILRKYNQWVL